MFKLLKYIVPLMVLMGIAVGVETGEDAGATSQLVASVQGDMLNIENVGTAPSVDFGGAKVMVGDRVVGIVPFNMVLGPNPYIFTHDVEHASMTEVNIPISGVMSGDLVVVTNGVGIYASVVA